MDLTCLKTGLPFCLAPPFDKMGLPGGKADVDGVIPENLRIFKDFLKRNSRIFYFEDFLSVHLYLT